MKINWVAYNFEKFDGYGRYGRHCCRSLMRLGVDVRPVMLNELDLPGWLQRAAGLDFSNLTIACTPPYMLQAVGGRQWSLSMTEGTHLPRGWVEKLNRCCEHVIVPCEHNRQAYVDSGVEVPVHVLHGGTSPEEFPVIPRKPRKPYKFLTLGDRGARKGWVEVWQSFYRAFGTPDDTPDVRLIIKTRPHTNSLIDLLVGGYTDQRISFWREDVGSMADVYAHADCFAIPSRSEGWGMPHREAAMSGLPVITLRYSGLDDGDTEKWSIPVERMRPDTVPASTSHMSGTWMRADLDELTNKMCWCYENPDMAKAKGRLAAQWLREHQTWMHSAQGLLELIERYG